MNKKRVIKQLYYNEKYGTCLKVFKYNETKKNKLNSKN